MNFLGDGSGLAEVLANDRRGGWQPGYMIHAVRVMKGKPDLPESQIGLLDYYMARHEFNQRVMQYAQEAAQQGLLKIPTQQPLNSDSSNSVRPTPTPMPEEFERMQAETNLSSVPKIKALEQATGWIAQLPRPLPADLNPIKCQIWNIDIVGSTAIAWVDWDHALERDTLIKKDGKWFLVGQRIIVGHGN